MLSIITSAIFFGGMISFLIVTFKVNRLVRMLDDNNIKIRRWSRVAAIKDLKEIMKFDLKEDIRDMCGKAIYLMKVSQLIFFGTSALVAGILISYGILNALYDLPGSTHK